MSQQRSLLLVAPFGRPFTGSEFTWCLLCSAFALKELHPLYFFFFFSSVWSDSFVVLIRPGVSLWCYTEPVFPAHVYVTPALILMNYTSIKAG